MAGLFCFAVCKPGIVAAEGIQFSIRADDVGAAAVNAVFVPRAGVHERLDEQPERVRFVQFELFEQIAERFRIRSRIFIRSSSL